MPKPLLILVLLLALAMGSTSPVTAQSADQQVRVEEIAVSGNRRVAIGTVLSYLPVRVGDSVSRSSLSIALERLYETDLFADINIDLEGSILRIDVVEKTIDAPSDQPLPKERHLFACDYEHVRRADENLLRD